MSCTLKAKRLVAQQHMWWKMLNYTTNHRNHANPKYLAKTERLNLTTFPACFQFIHSLFNYLLKFWTVPNHNLLPQLLTSVYVLHNTVLSLVSFKTGEKKTCKNTLQIQVPLCIVCLRETSCVLHPYWSSVLYDTDQSMRRRAPKVVVQCHTCRYILLHICVEFCHKCCTNSEVKAKTVFCYTVQLGALLSHSDLD